MFVVFEEDIDRKSSHSPTSASARSDTLVPSPWITFASSEASNSSAKSLSASMREILCVSLARDVARCLPISPAPTMMMFMRMNVAEAA